MALLLSEAVPSFSQSVRFGSDVFVREKKMEYQSLRLGLIVNQVSTVGRLHLADTLLATGFNVTAFFAPEHGIRGNISAGEAVKDGKDPRTGLPVISLYGKKKIPSAADMALVDAVVFDLQDVGARPFTYASTMAYMMEACARDKKEFIVLDRPNPLGGTLVSGWILEDSLRSFVGRFPIPLIHGLTLGELAQMIKGEKWVSGLDSLKLTVIPVSGLTRKMTWRETGKVWVGPSPNLTDLNAVFLYPGTVLVEGTTFSEGRGTAAPFLTIGSPNMKFSPKSLEKWSKKTGIGLSMSKTTPVDIPGKATDPKFEDRPINALQLHLKKSETPPLVLEFTVELLRTLWAQNPEQRTNSFLRKLAGTGKIDSILTSPSPFTPDWNEEVSRYIQQRKPYLIYE